MSATPRTEPSQAMAEAAAALTRAGVKFERKTAFHLKVQAWNFWPSSGKIFRNGGTQKLEERGLPAFIRLLRKEGLAKGKPVEAVNEETDFVVQVKPSETGFETY